MFMFCLHNAQGDNCAKAWMVKVIILMSNRTSHLSHQGHYPCPWCNAYSRAEAPPAIFVSEFLPKFWVFPRISAKILCKILPQKARIHDIRDKKKRVNAAFATTTKKRNCSINRFTTKNASEPLSGKTLSNKNQTQKHFFNPAPNEGIRSLEELLLLQNIFYNWEVSPITLARVYHMETESTVAHILNTHRGTISPQKAQSCQLGFFLSFSFSLSFPGLFFLAFNITTLFTSSFNKL